MHLRHIRPLLRTVNLKVEKSGPPSGRPFFLALELKSVYRTATPAYPTTMSRSPDTSPDVAYLTSSAEVAPNRLAAVNIAAVRPNPHMLLSAFMPTSKAQEAVSDK